MIPTKKFGMNTPPKLFGWNWGAFWLGPIWAFGNRVRGPFFWYMVLTVGSTPVWLWLVHLYEINNLSEEQIDVCCCLSLLLSIAHFFVYPSGILWLGLAGNQRAWENGHWHSLGEFKRIQRRWAIAGWLLGIPIALFNSLGVWVLLAMFFAACVSRY